MVASVKRIVVFFLHILGIFLAYPILLYLLQDYMSIYNNLPLLPFHSYIQVYLSGPGLIVIGIILFYVYKRKISGLCVFIIGVLWIATILYELITKN